MILTTYDLQYDLLNISCFKCVHFMIVETVSFLYTGTGLETALCSFLKTISWCRTAK